MYRVLSDRSSQAFTNRISSRAPQQTNKHPRDSIKQTQTQDQQNPEATAADNDKSERAKQRTQ